MPYMINNGVLYHADNELYHYGVKGMKWGHRKAQRLQNRVERKYKKAGRLAGSAEHYRNKANETYQKHDRMASVLDKQAKTYDSQGSYLKGEAARKTAAALRARGTNARKEYDDLANYYTSRAERNTQKASAYATKHRVDLGKKRIDAIVSESKKKQMDREREWEDFDREQTMRERFGDDIYEKVSGRR